MNDHYILTQAPAAGIAALATARNYERPDEYLFALQADLRERGVRGDIVLDLLAANGSPSRRFYSIPFDGTKFDPLRFTLLKDVAKELLDAAGQALRQHMADIDWALVSADRRMELLVGVNPATLRTVVRPAMQ